MKPYAGRRRRQWFFRGDLSTFQDFMPIPGFPIAESRARLDWAKPASTQDRFLD
jgi:hypothetical protein